MKRIIVPLCTVLSFFLLITASACRKDVKEDNPSVEPGNISPTPIGHSNGEPYITFVGPEGGTVTSADGRIIIDIPEGALSEETEISIEPLKNTSPGGIGNSYRLKPHGKIFNKKVAVQFSYENDERRISSTDVLKIAYQNESGIWNCVEGEMKDQVAKTISVKTDHFSDWSLITALELAPAVKTIGLSETVKLQALDYELSHELGTLVPPFLVDKHLIVKWTLNGPGKLEPKGSEAVFTAPSAKPSNNTATVTLELNVNGKQVLLISTIHIIDEGISISIDGGPWHTYMGIANKQAESNTYSFGNVRISEDLPQIICFWPASSSKSDGTYKWNMLGAEESNVVFQYTTPNLKHIYTSVYDDENNIGKDSPGFVSAEEIEQNGKKYIKGMFVIDKSGYFSVATAKQEKIGSIVGIFKVQRNW